MTPASNATSEPCVGALPARAGGTSEDALVAECTVRMVDGDLAAYETIFRARCDFVERESARRLGRRLDLADDVAQETWLRIARRPLAFESAPALDAWLRRVVRSAAVDMLRSELARVTRESAVARGREEAVRFLDDYELLEAIRSEVESLDGLTPDERAMFEWKARTDATTARLAAWLGIGHAAVDSKLRRAAERARAARGASETQPSTLDPRGNPRKARRSP